MIKLEFDRWIIGVNKEKTESFYKNYHIITDDCDCLYCNNYFNAISYLPPKLLDIFNKLGIDPTKEAEVYHCMKNHDETHLYGGFYHVVGKIESGEDCWREYNERDTKSNGFVSDDGFSYGFTKDTALVPENFPKPVIQFEFRVNIPWVIDLKP